MRRTIRCCINNLARFQYGSVLQSLDDQGHDVELEGCQNQCVGCRKQIAARIDGQWSGFDNPEQMLENIEKS